MQGRYERGLRSAGTDRYPRIRVRSDPGGIEEGGRECGTRDGWVEEVEKGGEYLPDRVVSTRDRVLRGDMAVRGVSEQQNVGEHRQRGRRGRRRRRRRRRGRGRPDVDGLREGSVAPAAESSSPSSPNAGRILHAEQRRPPSQR